MLSVQYHISLKNQYKMSFLNWPYSNAKEWLNISNLFTIFHNYENLPQFFIPKCLHSFDLTYKVTDWTIGLVWFWSFQHYMEKAENYFFLSFFLDTPVVENCLGLSDLPNATNLPDLMILDHLQIIDPINLWTSSFSVGFIFTL